MENQKFRRSNRIITPKAGNSNIQAKSRKLQIEVQDDDTPQNPYQVNLDQLFAKLQKNSPSNVRGTLNYPLFPDIRSSPKSSQRMIPKLSKSTGGTPKGSLSPRSSRKSSAKRIQKNRRLVNRINLQTQKIMRDILPSNPYAPRKIRNLTPRGAFTPKGSSTPKGRSTPRTRKSILPRNPRRIAPKATKKNSPLNQLVTRVDRTIVNTQKQLTPQQQEEKSQAIYQDHLFQTFNSLRFIRQVKTTDFEQIKEKAVNLPRPAGTEGKKTLVLDLDETLVHCNDDIETSSPDVILPIKFPTGEIIQAGINIRPFITECLEFASKNFEVMIFTASHQCYADVVLDYIDPQHKYIHHRLYRDSCINIQGVCIKDLRILLGRQLKDIIIVDNATHSFGFQLDNGIPIISWYDDYQDQELFNLIDYLKVLAEVEDIREVNGSTFNLDTFYDDYINEFLEGVDDETIDTTEDQ